MCHKLVIISITLILLIATALTADNYPPGTDVINFKLDTFLVQLLLTNDGVLTIPAVKGSKISITFTGSDGVWTPAMWSVPCQPLVSECRIDFPKQSGQLCSIFGSYDWAENRYYFTLSVNNKLINEAKEKQQFSPIKILLAQETITINGYNIRQFDSLNDLIQGVLTKIYAGNKATTLWGKLKLTP
ncbi:MAG: hypothetical protein A2445_00650 [Candidatus Jacksonbacteria bacterium RIFOXYC2_FULL_44_29]|nr:MAG: hypothetical protein UW45_C0010G0014 [Parcubacteria group bacterium GW2011_GWC2_44_22]OGY76065.1 MAG: hypothetical protein A2295_03865 [Candidatus Jacksonbacteria bacterium RIFOXYB2_FULL_44_15]OGY76368.1 MAG: hypothetical protein A2240_04380 [Candidatus Jacksonbacteria bacterium RIFOXYA2_FULL_43_12]OGY78006.1 MAG: hypothetical protein A2445_00650 [Candidatus Jacksonbacteria bacterium RIFOXYC2_FULL_44_29]OGY80322.1 MAG: hypothetical protein A2550_04435 [Candidatus Jacksonbacteria bacteri